MEICKTKVSERGPYRDNYTHDDLVDAYIAVVDGGSSVQSAALRYGVPITTLKDRVRNRINIDAVKSGVETVFTQEQEALLAGHINVMGEIGFGYTRMETIRLASDYAVHLGIRTKEQSLSLQWLYSFIGRWPELYVKKPRSLEIARAKSATPSAINRYFQELEKILDTNCLKDRPEAIFNVDEKGLSAQHKPPKIVCGKSYKAQAVTMGKSATVTMIPAVNALGNQYPPFFVFPGQRMMPGLMDGASAGASGSVSPTGWSNTDIFNQYMKEHLIKYLPHRSETAPVLVLYDGHKSHISLGLIEWAKSEHIILFVLPPHTSHLLQPLDVGCFSPLEDAWNTACHSYLKRVGGYNIPRNEVCKIACRVYSTTVTPANVQSAFRKSGIYPFDKTVISESDLAPSLALNDQTGNSDNTENPASSDVAQEGTSVQPAGPTTEDHESTVTSAITADAPCPVSFLEKRGGQLLANLKTAKKRNTLSKVVGGKAITDDDVVKKIQEHIQKQKPNKRKNPASVNSTSVTVPSPQEQNKSNPPYNPPSDNVEPLPKSLRKGTSKSNPSKGKAPKTKVAKAKVLTTSNDVDEESDSDIDVSEDSKCCVCKRFSPSDMRNLGYIKIVKWGQCDKCDRWVHLAFCSPVKVLRWGDTFICPPCSQ